MADSTDKKTKNTLDVFADDLDAMLNIADTPAQQVGLIDDDEAIDRLLVADEGFERGSKQSDDDFTDIDGLLGIDDALKKTDVAVDIDEFGDDFDVDININPGLDQKHADEDLDVLVDIDSQQMAAFDDDALQQIDDLDEFADEPIEPIVPVAPLGRASSPEPEVMAEIDDFADRNDTADFLLADFDISADEVSAPPEVDHAVIDEFSDASEASLIEDMPAIAPALSAATAVLDSDDDLDMPFTSQATQPEPVVEAPVVKPPVRTIDHRAEIVALTRQVDELKKQHKVIQQEVDEKAVKSELTACLDSLEGLQTEQKKNKRGLDALNSQKPVAAYVANGLAVTALLVGTGLGIQGMIAKSQVGELVAIIGKMQEQINTGPANDAAEKEMLRKQVDELTVSSGVMATQLADLMKGVGGNGSGNAVAPIGGDVGKQLTELSNQDMQMGAIIEALQAKVAALEKGRVVQAKPEKKKTEPVEENWAVNLVAFKQDWYAKRKAEEFIAKGVQAKVSKTEAKGESWYRLSVDGFKTQYEAAAYAAKVKKMLNLESAWVTRVKE